MKNNMNIFQITEPQIQEIAGRLNAMTVQGIANNQHIMGILAVLEQVANPKAEPDNSNVITLPEQANG